MRDGHLRGSLPRTPTARQVDVLAAHPASDLTVDHVVPLAAAGAPFDIGNCAVLCRSCNSTTVATPTTSSMCGTVAGTGWGESGIRCRERNRPAG